VQVAENRRDDAGKPVSSPNSCKGHGWRGGRHFIIRFPLGDKGIIVLPQATKNFKGVRSLGAITSESVKTGRIVSF
jgi:hypothetical protein